MNYQFGTVTELTQDQCLQKLAGEELGRLAVNIGSRVDIYPLNFAFAHGDIFFRTSPGTKLLELTINTDVVFEVDGHTDDEAWSVVARGIAERLERESQIDEAYGLPLEPWIPTLKMSWVRVHVTQLTGRQFTRAPEPVER
jgi:nitroimidazol reductase NimA-like FMN-containing flavoprotein (pyridoxamine 5'-phosphate oxidase superfamily)